MYTRACMNLVGVRVAVHSCVLNTAFLNCRGCVVVFDCGCVACDGCGVVHVFV